MLFKTFVSPLFLVALAACGNTPTSLAAPDVDDLGGGVGDISALPMPTRGTELADRAPDLLRGEVHWDAGPPDVVSVTFRVACGLTVGPFDIVLVRDGDVWQVDKTGAPPGYHEDIHAACMSNIYAPATWTDAGDIDFVTGGWLHSVSPSPMGGKWVGYVSRDDRTAACDAALAAHFVPYPVPLTMSRQ